MKMNVVKRLFILTILYATVSASGEDCHFQLAGDINGDCKINFADFSIMAQGWLVDCVATPGDPLCIPLDIDQDGFDVIVDCNDNDPTIYPGAPEIPNDGIDQDCDGEDATEPIIPITWVTITNDPGFTGEMSKYETTNGQYCQFLNAALASGDITVGADNIVYGVNGSNGGADFVGEIYFNTYAASSYSQITFDGSTFSVRSRDGYSMADHPVVMVSWYGSMAFASYYGFRLPTEWEWQAVADYDGSFTYGCGTTIDVTIANYDLANPHNLSGHPYTSPVDYFDSYGYGMNDMAGNVWEWTNSIYSGSFRVLRGGSWHGIDYYYCTVSFRNFYYPTSTHYDVGFRVCR